MTSLVGLCTERGRGSIEARDSERREVSWAH